jgi:endo-1,4-beta-xylanase
MLRTVWLALAIGVAAATLAQPPGATPRTPPPGGEQLVAPDDFTLFEMGSHRNGESRVVDVEGAPFKRAIRAQVKERGQQWDVEIGRPIPRAFKPGEILLMRAFVREIQSFDESGEALVNLQVAMRKGPWTAPIGRVATVDGGWQEFWIPGAITSGHANDELFIKLSCGEVRQTIEIGGIQLWVYPPGTALTSLPRTVQSYQGRESGASWRREAEARIKKLRTAPLRVQVLDLKGRPVPGVAIKAEMVRHRFPFGSAVSARAIAGPNSQEVEPARARFLRLFNSATLENDLKWPAWVGEFGPSFSRSQTMEALRWFRSRDVSVRGHVLVWPGYRNLPSFLRPTPAGPLSGAQMHALALSHIDEITGATAGLVEEWDVLNEPRDNHDIMDAAGRQVMVEWFQRARERAPHARLALNDYSILPSRHDGEAIKAYESNARYLISNGAPLDVLGFQGHMGGSYNPPPRLLQILDRFSKLKKPIRITEFTLKVEDQDLGHDYARDFLIAMFSHPSVSGVTTWGMGVMFRPDGSLTGPGKAWMSLIRGEWWTKGQGVSDQKGTWSLPATLGRYRVTVGEAVFEVDLERDSRPFVFTLPTK